MSFYQSGLKFLRQYLVELKIGALLAATSISLTLLLTPLLFQSSKSQSLAVGDIARQTIRSPIDFFLEDKDATNRLLQERRRSVPRIFTLELSANYDVATRAKSFFDALRKALKSGGGDNIPLKQRKQIELQFGIDLEGSEWDLIADNTKWRALLDALVQIAEPVVTRGIVLDKKVIEEALSAHGVVLEQAGTENRRNIFSTANLYDVSEAERALLARIPEEGFGRGELFDRVMRSLVKMYLSPNVFYDSLKTESAISQALSEVNPVMLSVKKREVIVRTGDQVSEIQSRKIAQLAELQGGSSVGRISAGLFILITIILVSVYFFFRTIWHWFRLSVRDLSLISLTLVGSVSLVRAFSVVGDSLGLSFSNLDAAALILAAPVAAGGILLEVTLGPASVFLFTLTFALLTGVFLEESWLFLLFVILGNIVGSVSVTHCPKRSAFLWSGIRVAVMNAIVILCFVLLYPQFSFGSVATRLALGLMGGLFSGVLAAGLTPIAEYIGSYVTDIKLLELASLDRPLLRELVLRAPGTWNHSMVMGQLGESAANAIGANGLLTRVGAYYHDVGKLNKPSYFVENQERNGNRHDKLAPSMSALIIKAHVKDGVELAAQHKLPKAIIDFIPQHHGTSLIEYFYEKAKKSEKEQVVDPTHYRYGGPKPQTKEAGILMLADGVEAAARTLTDPSPAKLQGLVQKMINKAFISGELDESALTLRDLHLIAKSFTFVLAGIHHRRVDYKEPADKQSKSKLAETETKEAGPTHGSSEESSENIPKSAEVGPDREAQSATDVSEGNRKEKQSAKENEEPLKRLGM